MRRRFVASKSPTPHLGESAALQLHDHIALSVKHHRLFPKLLVRMLVAAIGVVSALWTVQGFYQFPSNMHTVLLTGVLSCVIFSLLFRLPRRFRWSMVLILLGFEAVIYRHWDACLAGYRTVYRVVTAKIHKQERIIDSLTSTAEWSETQCTTFFTCGLAFILSMCICYFVIVHPNFLVCSILTFPFLEGGLFFGYETDSMAVFGLVGFWLTVLAMQCANHTLGSASNATNKRRKDGTVYVRSGTRSMPSEAMAVFLLLLTFGGGYLAMQTTKSYIRSVKIDQTRDRIRQKFNSYAFEDVTGLLSRLPLPFTNNLLADEVDLTTRGDVNFDGGAVMEIDVDTSFQPRDLYLRGICRSTYTGIGWKVPTRVYRQQRDMFAALTQQGIYPQSLSFCEAHAQAGTSFLHSAPPAQMHITALKQELVNYLPYQTIYSDPACDPIDEILYDTELRLQNQQKYNLALDTTTLPNWENLALSLHTTRSSEPARRDYEDFATTFYTNIEVISPELEAVRKDFAATIVPCSTYADALAQVRDYIWERTNYTLHPGNTPRGQDFAAYFLTQSHAGYCAHYATTAVLLCRTLGIPARYVQGYVISETDFTKLPSGEQYHIALPDYRAHAWAEIFVPTIGWMPYEFTEGIVESWHAASPLEVPTDMTTDMTPPLTTTTTSSPLASHPTDSATSATTPHSVNSTETTGQHTPLLTRTQRILLVTLLLLCVTALFAVLGIRAYHNRVIRQRTEAMDTKQPNRAADAGYQFLLQLLRQQGIRQGTRAHEAFAAYAQKQCTLLPEGAMETAVAIEQAVVFSGKEISSEDAETVTHIALELAARCYAQASRLQKLWLRWIAHIVP